MTTGYMYDPGLDAFNIKGTSEILKGSVSKWYAVVCILLATFQKVCSYLKIKSIFWIWKKYFIFLSKCFLKINFIEVELIYKNAAHIYRMPFGEYGHITYTPETTITIKVVNTSSPPKVYSCPILCICVCKKNT